MGARASFMVGDWTTAIAGGFDAIVGNPPYIESAEIARLPPEVRDYDPRLALDGGDDGLSAYRRIAADARRILVPGGLFAAAKSERGRAKPSPGLFWRTDSLSRTSCPILPASRAASWPAASRGKGCVKKWLEPRIRPPRMVPAAPGKLFGSMTGSARRTWERPTVTLRGCRAGGRTMVQGTRVHWGPPRQDRCHETTKAIARPQWRR